MKSMGSEIMITARAVIFDTDGTLINTTKRFYIVFNRILQKHGRKPIAWKAFFKRYSADALDTVIAPPRTKNRNAVLHRFWLEFLTEYRSIPVTEDSLIPGVKEVLEAISEQGGRIAIVTSCIVPAHKLELELSHYGIKKFARAVVTGADAVKELTEGHHFSKEGIFERAINRLGVSPVDCVIVGDYWNDVEAGKKLGTKTIAVLSGSMEFNVLAEMKPDAIIKSVRDLPEVVKFGPTQCRR